MAIEQTVLLFREYARQVFNEQSEYLVEYNKNYLLSGKLARLRFFNAHMKTLKQKLNERMAAVLSAETSKPHYEELKNRLQSVSLEYINEYTYIGFTKNE